MADRIEGVGRIRYSQYRVNSVQGNSAKDRERKIAKAEQEASEKAEIRAYLANFPNPKNLSFAELLEIAVNGTSEKEDEEGYTLDIGNHQDDDGFVLDIK